MAQVSTYDEVIHFDTARFPFDSIILAAVRSSVKPLHTLTDLSEMHTLIAEGDRRAVETAIYDAFVQPEFERVYDALCREIIDERYSGRARYQAIPSVRIQLPGTKSVNFHTDEWYGHGHEVNNFWLPLVAVERSQSMMVVDEATSARLMEQMKQRRISILDMNDLCLPHSRSLAMEFGDIYVFNAHMLHGTVVNDTDRTRVSFDFRMLVGEDDRGAKDPSYFIAPNSRRRGVDGKPRATAGIYCSGNLATDLTLSQKYQQLICLRYASERGLDAQVLETELWGFDHYPNLWDMVSGSYAGRFQHLILFSTKLLPSSTDERERLVAEAKRRGLTLHFVAEDIASGPGEALRTDGLERNFNGPGRIDGSR